MRCLNKENIRRSTPLIDPIKFREANLPNISMIYFYNLIDFDFLNETEGVDGIVISPPAK